MACGNTFPDSSKTDDEWERALALHFFSRKRNVPSDLSNEQKRYANKWFDYRGIHAGAATAWYMECFKAEYGRAVRKWIDHTEGSRTGVTARKLFDLSPTDVTGFWRGRQAADDAGIPYPVYVRAAIDKAILKGNWRLPRPGHLYSDECRAAASLAWAEQQRAKIWIPLDKFYLASNYVGHQDQDDFHAWVIGALNYRGCNRYSLSKVVFENPVLPQSVAAGAFPNIFADAQNYYLDNN